MKKNSVLISQILDLDFEMKKSTENSHENIQHNISLQFGLDRLNMNTVLVGLFKLNVFILIHLIFIRRQERLYRIRLWNNINNCVIMYTCRWTLASGWSHLLWLCVCVFVYEFCVSVWTVFGHSCVCCVSTFLYGYEVGWGYVHMFFYLQWSWKRQFITKKATPFRQLFSGKRFF